MPHAFFEHASIPPAAGAALSPAVTWNGERGPGGRGALGIVAVAGAAPLGRRSRSSGAHGSSSRG
jgi:hypothetical protein